MTAFALTNHGAWGIALIIALVLAQIVDEAVIQDGYMNALTDGYGGVPA